MKAVKAHHNVGGLPEDLKFELVEPLKYLFKDEVRAVGKALGLPDSMVYRQPFPGPGLGVRCLGAITRERLEIVRESDAILRDELQKAGLAGKVWQYFTACLLYTSKAGKLIVKEAVERGLDVTAIDRGENRSAAKKALVRDLFDLTNADLKGFDVVVDAFGAWTPETLPLHSASLKHLCDILSGTDTRLLVVGGAGSLYVNPEHSAQVMDGPDFPEVFKPLATNMGKALEMCIRDRNTSENTSPNDI